jgi:hypothetical protein
VPPGDPVDIWKNLTGIGSAGMIDGERQIT